jgi:hypothetical protein
MRLPLDPIQGVMPTLCGSFSRSPWSASREDPPARTPCKHAFERTERRAERSRQRDPPGPAGAGVERARRFAGCHGLPFAKPQGA